MVPDRSQKKGFRNLSNVYHLVSTVEGYLHESVRFNRLTYKVTFPGGSITGAPKIRAMQIIDELEPT